MKSRFIKVVICCITTLILLTGILPVLSVNGSTVGEAQSFIGDITAYKQSESGASSIQALIDGSLTSSAGSSEWYVIALSQYGNYDFSSYESALLKYLSENSVSSASSRQKYALALIAVGSTDSYIYDTLNDSIGKQGVMSWIFGLHLLNNGYSSNDYSLSAVKQKLLSLQLSDGGWAVTGSNGDVDVTAMAIQALAPYYESDSSVEAAVDNALSLLSDRQKDSGDYASYGVNNPESTAQVLVALSSLGIDAENDERFIKNGNTLFDGIRLYQLSDGSFCHKLGGSSNANATVQVFYSMISYLRMKNGQSSLYLLDARNPSGLNIPDNDTVSSSNDNTQADNKTDTTESSIAPAESDETTASDINTSDTSDTAADDTATGSDTEASALLQNNTFNQDTASSDNKAAASNGYKLWISIAVALIACASCAILYFKKKRNIKNFIVILGAAAAAIILVFTTNFQTTADYYKNAAAVKENSIGTVTLTIRCDTIPDKTAEHIPDNGIILDTTTVDIEEGDTVYNILTNVTAKNKLHLEKTGNGDSIYIKGINNIYEFDFGDLSGWIYHVNGESPSVSCGEYVVSDGDVIEWLYSCELGKDLE